MLLLEDEGRGGGSDNWLEDDHSKDAPPSLTRTLNTTGLRDDRQGQNGSNRG